MKIGARREPGDAARAHAVTDVAALGYQHWLGARSPGAAVLDAPGSFRRLWGRSLQLRVAVTTLVVTGVFVFLVGVYLVNRISSGVLSAKQTAAKAQAETGRQVAQRDLAGVSVGDVAGVLPVLQQLYPVSSDDDNSDGALYYTSIKFSSAALQANFPDQPAIPEALRDTVKRGTEAIQYAQVTTPAKTRMSALIVGQLVSSPATSFELYYFFPLGAEQETVSLVQTTVLLAGLGLMLLIASIAVLVTRQAVGPVRAVSQTARRLSDGDLSQRVPVQGTDELAVLAGSFNEMASSLQKQFRRMDELSRLQRRFTSDVSHELRTPLTTVRMAAEIIYARRDEFPADLSRSSELMYAELDRFEALLGDLLEISRYDAGVARLDIETVDLRSVVAAAVDGTADLARRKGCSVVVQPRAQPVTAEVDPRRIERILRNLVGNAIDHSEGLPVTIQVDTDGVAATVDVRDHGVGLRPGEAGLVFNRFWRGDPSRSRLTGGTGLGLSISMEDARLHGGWLQAWGERNRGSLFRLTLPLRADRPLPSRPTPLEPTAADDVTDAVGPVRVPASETGRSARTAVGLATARPGATDAPLPVDPLPPVPTPSATLAAGQDRASDGLSLGSA